MNKVKKINIIKIIVITTISFFVPLLTVSKVIIGAMQTTKDMTYLAIGHYLFDYFTYIHHIAQGMRGYWLVDNPYDPFDRSKTFIAFGQYLLLGKLAWIFHWSPFFTFWLTVFVLSIVFSLLIFYFIKRLLPKEPFYIQILTWLIALFATPFVKIINTNNDLKIVPYEYWYGPMSIFHRFGLLPHHLVSMILIIVVLLLIDNLISGLNDINRPRLIKKTLVIGLLLVFLLSFAPFQVINIGSGLFILSWIYFNLYFLKNNRKNVFKLIFFLGFIFVMVLPSAIYFKTSIQSIDYFKRASLWEIGQQHYPGFWEFFAVAGPILIFVPFGIKRYLRTKTPLKLLFFFFTLACYVYFYSPLASLFGGHNGRFINPIVYILFAVLTTLGIKSITSVITKKPVLMISLLVILLGYSLIVTSTIYKSIPGVDVFSYLPKNLIYGIKILDRQPDNKAVLTSPMLPLGSMLPAIVDRKVYLGNFLSTINYESKTVIVDQFYAGLMPEEQAKQLLMENNIGYVILSSLETRQYGNYKVSVLEAYSFLKKIYQNQDIVIFQVR